MTLRRTFLFLASIGLAAACGGAGDNSTSDTSGGTAGTTAGDDGGTAGTSSGGTAGDDGGTGTGDDGGTSTSGNTGGNTTGGNNNGGSDGGTGGTTTGVSILVEPNGNKGGELVAAIKAAKTSVHMTMYLLSSTDVINALIDRRNAGVDVKVVLNQNFPSGTSNTSSFNTLKGNGVSVVWAPSAFTYTHEKCVIIDGKTAWIMTMNATYSSPIDNREYLAIDADASDVAEAEKVFEADYAGSSVTLNGSLLVAPVNAREGLVALIGTATKTVDVEGEEFSDTGVVNALVKAANNGITVRVVVANSPPAASQTTAINTVKSAGIKVRQSGGTSGSSTASNPYIHAKAMVVDGVRGYVGSANFSGGSLGYNREVGLVVNDATEIGKVQTTIDTDWSAGTAL